MSSGSWAGAGAADHALRSDAPRTGTRAGTVGLRELPGRTFSPAVLTEAVQEEAFPYDINYFRAAGRLLGSLQRLDTLWREVSDAGAADRDTVLRARESAAMLATVRWMYRSALARTETRGMHRREDFPRQDERQRHYVTSGGLDEVWTATRPKADALASEAAE